ncbi:hypothetical protein IMCC9480_1016 [Oxalobacteraceae bacterium IMCC9480]|nr:hypothetical protein IMCC9480_1016 [Oxalobacteraceae bacterium IMCC9480]
MLLQHLLGLFDAFALLFEQQLGFGLLFGKLALLALPVIALGGQRIELRLQAAARFDDELDLGFEAADFGIGLVQRALRLMQAVTGSKMRLPHVLEFQLDMAQLGGFLLECGLGFFDLHEKLVLLGLRFVLAHQPEQFLLFFLIGLHVAKTRGDSGLCVKLFEVGIEFAQDVFDPQQIFARVVQPVFGFAAALLVLRDAGGFFQKDAQLFRPRFDDARNHALPDDRVGAWSEAGAKENILDIAPPDGLVVDVIGRGAVAGQRALDGDFGVLAPLPGGLAIRVIEQQFDRGTPGRLAVRGAIENHVLHRFATQLRGFRFSEYPAHCIDDVGFAAAIRSDHPDQLTRHLEIGRVNKRFEAGEFNGG